MPDNVSDLEHVPSEINPTNSLEEAASRLSGLFDSEDAPPDGEQQAEEQESPTEDEGASEQEAASEEAPVEIEEEETETEEVEEVPTPPQPEPPSRHDPELIAQKEQLKQRNAQAQEVLNRYLDQLGNPEAPDAKLIEDDPMEYMRQDAKFKQDEAARAKAYSELQNLQREQYAEFLQEQQTILKAELPQLFDGEPGQKPLGEIRDYAVKQGYDETRLAWASAQDVKTLFAAMNYEKMQKTAPATKKKLEKAPPVLKSKASTPKANPKAEAAKASRAKLKKSGDYRDFANMLLQDEGFG